MTAKQQQNESELVGDGKKKREYGDKYELSNNAKTKLGTLYRDLFKKPKATPDLVNLKWVEDNHKKLYNIIMTKPTITKDSSRKTSVSALVSAFKKLQNKTLEDYYDKIRDTLQEKLDDEYGKNEKTDRHIGTYEEFIALRNKLQKTRNKSLVDNYKYLITAVFTYQYPLRYEWRNVKFSNEPYENTTRDENDKQHYLMTDKYGDMILSLGEYKAHDPIDIPLNNTLKEIILESLNKFKRAYLFSRLNDKNRHITGTEFVGIRDTLNFGDEKNFRSLRYSYENNRKKLIENDKKKMAVLMRTSVSQLEKVYKKVKQDDTESKEESLTNNRVSPVELQKIVTDEIRKQMSEHRGVIDPPNPPQPQVRAKDKSRAKDDSNYYVQYYKKNQPKMQKNSRKYYEKNSLKVRAKKYAYKLNLPAGSKDRLGSPTDRLVDEYKLEKGPDGKWQTKL